MADAKTYASPPRAKILIGISDLVRERVMRLLERHELVVANTRTEALQILNGDGYEMVILDVHFDESQMFNVLGDIRLHTKHRTTPVVVVYARGSNPASAVMLAGLDHAVRALLGNALLDLDDFPDDEKGNERFRRIIDYLLLLNGDLHHVAEKTGDPSVVAIVERRSKGR